VVTTHTIVHGDSRKMSLIADESVHLIITSPPYWQLKDYGNDNQIGFNSSYEEYINQLNLVWYECNRVLHNGCRLCINIGDQFARSVYYGRYKVIPIRTEIIKFCETIGLDYMGSVIWQKVTTTNTTGGASIMGSFPYPRNGVLKLDYEFILLFKKLGDAPKPSQKNKELSKMTNEEWNTYFNGHWNFAGAKQDGHHAQFPEELPKRLIKMFSFVKDTILDPFVGSGTTSLAAKNLDRNSIGYEINEDYIALVKKKLAYEQYNVFNSEIRFVADNSVIDSEALINELPYIYEDPHKLNNKIDMKKLQYGSKIDVVAKDREDFHSVKEVISPCLVKLDNDLVVRLIGIKEKAQLRSKAVDYLNGIVKGARVFMKYDTSKYDDSNHLLCYLYLKNKTFINAHLVKKGYVDVDIVSVYKNKDKFLSLVRGHNE